MRQNFSKFEQCLVGGAIIDEHDTILNAGHYINGFRNRDRLNIDPSEIPGICTGMCEVIEKFKEADMKLL